MNTVVLLIIVILVYFLYKNYESRCLVYRFYKPGCVWCERSEWEWYKFRISNLVFSKIRTVDCNVTVNKEMAKKFGVTTVPHFALLDKNGLTHKYEGNRTKDDLNNWVNSFNL